MAGWQDGAEGRIGESGVFLSDLLARALLAQTSGVLRVYDAAGEAYVFVRQGTPIHVSGTLVLHDFLGQILTERGVVTQEAVEASYTAQETEAAADPSRRRPLGAILVANLGVDPDAVETAVREQIARRLAVLAGLTHPMWSTKLGGLEPVERIAAPVDGWGTLATLIRELASDAELGAISDELLGHAVRVTAPLDALTALRLRPEEIDFFRYLDRPRKTHQLELVAPSRRRARTLLKTLRAVGVLELLPAAQGVPIKEAVKNVQVPGALPREDAPRAAPAPPPRSETPPPVTAPPVTAPPVAKKNEPPLVRELREISERIGKVSYYDLLGVKQDAGAIDIRTAYTTAAKKYHPDAIGPDMDESLAALARGVAAAFNDAYTTLSDAEKRGKYDANLKSGAVVIDDQSASRAAGARTKYEMGLVHLRRHEYARARDMFRLASDMHPQNGLFKGYFAWALFADPQSERAEAVLKASKLLEEAIALTPKEASLHYYRGRVLKERGDMEDAELSFRRALAIEPKHKDAATELRLIAHRKKAENDKDREPKDKDKGVGSVLSRFLKR